MKLETERLIIREWRDSDLDCLMTISRDIGYNCFTRPGHFMVHGEDEAGNKLRIIDKLGSAYLGDFTHVAGMTFRLYDISRNQYLGSAPENQVKKPREDDPPALWRV